MSRLDHYKDYIEDLADYGDEALLETYDHGRRIRRRRFPLSGRLSTGGDCPATS